MNKKSIHVISRGNRWALIKRGAIRATRLYDNKQEAIEEGKKYLKKGYDLFVHRKDGMVDFWKKAPAELRQVA
jgi:hypothetical protein